MQLSVYLVDDGTQVDVFTDNANLKRLLVGPELDIGAPARQRLTRWLSFLTAFNLRAHILTSEQNAFADWLTRPTSKDARKPRDPEHSSAGPTPAPTPAEERHVHEETPDEVLTMNHVNLADLPDSVVEFTTSDLPTAAEVRRAQSAWTHTAQHGSLDDLATRVMNFREDVKNLQDLQRFIDGARATRTMTEGQRRQQYQRQQREYLDRIGGHPEPPLPYPDIVINGRTLHVDPDMCLYVLSEDEHHPWFVPDTDNLRLRHILGTHTATLGHYGVRATTVALTKHAWWPGVRGDVERVVQACMFCVATHTPRRVPRPLLALTHSLRPFGQLWVDFLFVSNETDNTFRIKQLLVITDDLSMMSMLLPVEQPNATNTAAGLTTWFGQHGLPDLLCMDQASYFTGNVIKNLTDKYHVRRSFCVPHVHQTHGNAERTNRTIINLFRVIMAATDMDYDQWDRVVPTVQLAMNSLPRHRLGGRSPIEYLALETTTKYTPAMEAVISITNTTEEALQRHIMDTAAAIVEHIETLHDEARRRSLSARKAHREPLGTKDINYTDGQCVLAATPNEKEAAHKLVPIWSGPYRLFATDNPRVYDLEPWTGGRRFQRHAAYITLFNNGLLGKTANLELLQQRWSRDVYMNDIVGHKYDDGDTFLHVNWKGGWLPSDTNWEPIDKVYRTIPGKLEKYIDDIEDGEQRERLRRSLKRVHNAMYPTEPDE